MVNRLLLLNGIAIINVILFHASGFGFTALFFWAHRYRPVTSPNFDAAGGAVYYGLRLIEQWTEVTIPAFVFVSGFFVSVVAGRQRSPIGLGAMRGRIRALVIPYLFWTTVVLVGLVLEGRVLSLGRYLRVLLTGSVNANYYFVPLLVQLYALAPVVVWLARRRWQALIVGAATLQAAVYLLQYPMALGVDDPVVIGAAIVTQKWVFVTQFFWFSLGVVAGFRQQAFKALVHRFRWPLLIATGVLFVGGCVEWETLIALSSVPWTEHRVTLVDGLFAGAFICAFLGFSEARLPYSRPIGSLGARSFGIYLVHGIAMEYVARGVYHLAPGILGRQALFLPLVIAVGLAVPLLLMRVVERSSVRSVYPHIFG